MKSPPKKRSLLGRLKSGLGRLLGTAGQAEGAGAEAGSAAPPRRTKKDLFPPEPKAARASKPPIERPERPAGRHEKTARRPAPHRREDRRGGPREPRDEDRRRREWKQQPPPKVRSEPHESAPSPAPPPPPIEPVGPFPEAFEALGLPPRVLAGARDLGYITPTEIQSKAIPLVLGGRDVIGASQTGTGKTAAFGLPIFARLEAPGPHPRVLVLEPTRELACQVVDSLQSLGRHTGVRTLAIYGGVGYDKQRKGLHTGADILVATPGRLLDFMRDKTIRLDTVQILVLDEVDRMLDMGFLPDVRKIVEKCPRGRQTLFFSATMPPQIKTLADWALREPVEVEVGIRFSPAETVSHYFYPVAADQREALLMELLEQTHYHSVMIFTRTKAQADKLYAGIKSKNYPVAVMHSDIAQRDRETALKGFRDGQFEVIVATDLAARGLDITSVTHVINYQVPENPEDYVHRIGRTGRAEKEGDAFTLLSADELPFAEAIERLIGQKIERRSLENFSYEYTTLLDPDAAAAKKKRPRGGGPRRRRR